MTDDRVERVTRRLLWGLVWREAEASVALDRGDDGTWCVDADPRSTSDAPADEDLTNRRTL